MSESNGTNGERQRVEPFTRLVSNVKGLIDDQLGPMTAWVGDNRTGKTSRVDAIRLAITGKHPAGPHGSDLMELVPEGASTLFAELSGPSGSTRFVVETEGGKAKKPGKPEPTGLYKAVVQEKDLETILPMQSMRDLIDLGSTRGREAIFRRFGSIVAVPVPRGLSETQTKLWNDGLAAVKASNPKADSAELLSLLAAWMRQRKLAIGREIKALDNLVKEREQTVKQYAAGEEELPALRDKLKLAEAWDQAESLRQRKAQLEADGEAYKAKVAPFLEADQQAEAKAKVQKAEDEAWKLKLANIKTAALALQERLLQETKLLHGGEWLVATLKLNAEKADAEGHAPCLLCGNPAFTPAEAKAQVEPRVEARRASWEGAQDEIAKNHAEYQETEAAYRGWQLTVSEAERKYEADKTALRFEYTRIKTALDEVNRALEGSPSAYDGPPTMEVRRQIKAREDASTLSRQLDQDVQKLRNLHVEQDLAKALEGEATKELSGLLVRTSEAAHTAVNTYMAEGFRAEIDLETAKWKVLGMDGRPHRRDIMAGSERGALIPALALGWTEGAPARFLILDDDDLAPFSPMNLRRLFDTLKDALDDGLLTQVFVTSSRPDEIPDYVTKIHTTAPTAAKRLDIAPAPAPVPVQAVPADDVVPAPAPAAPDAVVVPPHGVPFPPSPAGGLLL